MEIIHDIFPASLLNFSARLFPDMTLNIERNRVWTDRVGVTVFETAVDQGVWLVFSSERVKAHIETFDR